MRNVALTLTATRPLRQIFDFGAAFDARHGSGFNDLELPEPPDRPDSTLWQRAPAEVARRLALVVLHNNHVPGFAYNAILPLAETWAIEVGK